MYDVKSEERKELFNLIKELSFREGNFTLASGKTSKYMLDLSTTLRTALGQNLLSFVMVDKIPYGVLLGGPMTGSDLVCAAAIQSGICDEWFGIRTIPKKRGLDVEEISGNFDSKRPIWMVEDVCTSGGTLRRAVEVVQRYGGKVHGLFTVVDRGGLKPLAEELGVKCSYIYKLEEFIN